MTINNLKIHLKFIGQFFETKMSLVSSLSIDEILKFFICDFRSTNKNIKKAIKFDGILKILSKST